MSKVTKLSLKRLLWANPWGFAIPLLLGVMASVAGVALLGISGWFLSAAGLAGVLGLAHGFNYFTPGALVRLMAILRTAGRYGEQVSAHEHLLGLLKTLRLWVWDQRVEKDPANLHQQSRGDLLQRLVSDLDQIIRWPLVVMLPWTYALLAYLGVSVVAYLITPSLLLPILIAALLHLILVPYLCGRYASHSVHVGQILGTHRRGRFVSLFSALITLTIRGHWQTYAERLGQLDKRQKKAEVTIQQAISLGRLASYTVTIGLLASFFYLLMDYQASTGELTLIHGVQATWVVALVLSVLAVNELALPLSQSFVAQGQSQVGIRRLNQLHSAKKTKETPTQAPLAPITQIELTELRGYHLSSGLGNAPITMSLKVNDIIWLQGGSGCGKSTLLAAIAGDCLSEGQAWINGEVSQLYDNKAYQSQLSYLPQTPYVFQQSLQANLRLGALEATDQELWKVLDAVALGNWARSLPQGLNTLLGAQGRNLSGGQRKRLVLARLLLRKTPILLLDEPFDGLDSESIKQICHTLQNDYQPQTLVLISHIPNPLSDHAKTIQL
ncbi:amino acid ABC transporter ATP-binding/permease protein [Marinomonas pollencensis]|uniref:ATP-binding cassette subfamily C protein CydC n=1 Tax=Marinomonas pollencensis TaxID=491954 RepID=A0A3E0DVW1_9GAMM|nr:ATP-binding cassette domain-containing protein [Marinomonas pollencensis]REG86634.1 ATP-binding cassette subfamily C protein CydC [Marinomonas pollencensis]